MLRVAPGALLAGWDPDELDDARNYRAMPTISALWALTTSVSTFAELTGQLAPTTEFRRAYWGTGTVGEALVWLGHEFTHHHLDVDERAVRSVGQRRHCSVAARGAHTVGGE